MTNLVNVKREKVILLKLLFTDTKVKMIFNTNTAYPPLENVC